MELPKSQIISQKQIAMRCGFEWRHRGPHGRAGGPRMGWLAQGNIPLNTDCLNHSESAPDLQGDPHEHPGCLKEAAGTARAASPQSRGEPEGRCWAEPRQVTTRKQGAITLL